MARSRTLAIAAFCWACSAARPPPPSPPSSVAWTSKPPPSRPPSSVAWTSKPTRMSGSDAASVASPAPAPLPPRPSCVPARVRARACGQVHRPMLGECVRACVSTCAAELRGSFAAASPSGCTRARVRACLRSRARMPAGWSSGWLAGRRACGLSEVDGRNEENGCNHENLCVGIVCGVSEHVLRHDCRHGRHGTAHTGLCLLRTADLSEASDPNIWVDGSRFAVGIHSRKDTCMRDAPRMHFGARMFCTVASMERSPLRLRYSMRRSTFAAPSRLIYPHAWAILAYQT